MIDLAHNEVGLEALLEIMAGIRAPGARLLLGLGAVGDRTDDLIGRLGEIGAMGADVVAIGHKEKYLRGRTLEELEGLLRDGAERVGVTDVAAYPTEVECLAALVDQAHPGDVVGLMCHAERQGAYDWIAEHGGSADTPQRLGEKVRAGLSAALTGSSSRWGWRSATEMASSRTVGSAPGPGRASTSPGARGQAARDAVAVRHRGRRSRRAGRAAVVRPATSAGRPIGAARTSPATGRAPVSVRSYSGCPDPVRRQQAVGDQRVEPGGQDRPGDVEVGLEVGEPAYAEEAVAQDQHRPPLAHELEGPGERAVLPRVVGAEGHRRPPGRWKSLVW